jgi:hypothetical protein
MTLRRHCIYSNIKIISRILTKRQLNELLSKISKSIDNVVQYHARNIVIDPQQFAPVNNTRFAQRNTTSEWMLGQSVATNDWSFRQQNAVSSGWALGQSVATNDWSFRQQNAVSSGWALGQQSTTVSLAPGQLYVLSTNPTVAQLYSYSTNQTVAQLYSYSTNQTVAQPYSYSMHIIYAQPCPTMNMTFNNRSHHQIQQRITIQRSWKQV